MLIVDKLVFNNNCTNTIQDPWSFATAPKCQVVGRPASSTYMVNRQAKRDGGAYRLAPKRCLFGLADTLGNSGAWNWMFHLSERYQQWTVDDYFLTNLKYNDFNAAENFPAIVPYWHSEAMILSVIFFNGMVLSFSLQCCCNWYYSSFLVVNVLCTGPIITASSDHYRHASRCTLTR